MAGSDDRMNDSRRRLEQALASGEAMRARMLDAHLRRTGAVPSDKERRRLERTLRREDRRARFERERGFRGLRAQGILFAITAAVLAGLALTQARRLWWLAFVAFGFGSAAAKFLARAREQREEVEASALPSIEVDPRDSRVDELCARLDAELRAGPPLVRELVHQPEQTIEALRRSCHELTRRERELRAHLASGDLERLRREHETLSARIAAESDAITRDRLQGALNALEEQQRQRAEIERAATRLEAEHTRLTWTLENLYSQVIRVKSADAASLDVAGASLRQSVEKLGSEMDAIAEALEAVHQERPAAIGALEGSQQRPQRERS